MPPLMTIGAHGSFVAVVRKSTEIVLVHPDRETLKSAAPLFPQHSRRSLDRCRYVFSLHRMRQWTEMVCKT